MARTLSPPLNSSAAGDDAKLGKFHTFTGLPESSKGGAADGTVAGSGSISPPAAVDATGAEKKSRSRFAR